MNVHPLSHFSCQRARVTRHRIPRREIGSWHDFALVMTMTKKSRITLLVINSPSSPSPFPSLHLSYLPLQPFGRQRDLVRGGWGWGCFVMLPPYTTRGMHGTFLRETENCKLSRMSDDKILCCCSHKAAAAPPPPSISVLPPLSSFESSEMVQKSASPSPPIDASSDKSRLAGSAAVGNEHQAATS